MNNNTENATGVEWQSVEGEDSYEAWEDVLNKTYGSWDVGVNRSKNFSASLKTKQFGSVSVAECRCDPCFADRSQSNISKSKSEQLTIQLVRSGVERMQFGGNDYKLEAGDVFIWDNTQKMTFNIEQPLDKVSIILPLSRLKNWIPRTWHSIPRQIKAGSNGVNLLNSHILSLADSASESGPVYDDALAEATIALLLYGLKQNPVEDDVSLKHGQLESVKMYINDNLDNPELNLGLIAKANRISLRYLHWLFGGTGTTASRYIIEQRLDHCRRDLVNPTMKNRSISEIAFAWGFNDPTHFSKRFKVLYGETPSQTRS